MSSREPTLLSDVRDVRSRTEEGLVRFIYLFICLWVAYDTTRESAYLESSRHELRQITHLVCFMYLILERSFKYLDFIGFNAVATQYGTWITRVHPLFVGTCCSSLDYRC